MEFHHLCYILLPNLENVYTESCISAFGAIQMIECAAIEIGEGEVEPGDVEAVIKISEKRIESS